MRAVDYVRCLSLEEFLGEFNGTRVKLLNLLRRCKQTVKQVSNGM